MLLLTLFVSHVSRLFSVTICKWQSIVTSFTCRVGCMRHPAWFSTAVWRLCATMSCWKTNVWAQPPNVRVRWGTQRPPVLSWACARLARAMMGLKLCRWKSVQIDTFVSHVAFFFNSLFWNSNFFQLCEAARVTCFQCLFWFFRMEKMDIVVELDTVMLRLSRLLFLNWCLKHSEGERINHLVMKFYSTSNCGYMDLCWNV